MTTGSRKWSSDAQLHYYSLYSVTLPKVHHHSFTSLHEKHYHKRCQKGWSSSQTQYLIPEQFQFVIDYCPVLSVSLLFNSNLGSHVSESYSGLSNFAGFETVFCHFFVLNCQLICFALWCFHQICCCRLGWTRWSLMIHSVWRLSPFHSLKISNDEMNSKWGKKQRI